LFCGVCCDVCGKVALAEAGVSQPKRFALFRSMERSEHNLVFTALKKVAKLDARLFKFLVQAKN
jgi:hypothetical protein